MLGYRDIATRINTYTRHPVFIVTNEYPVADYSAGDQAFGFPRNIPPVSHANGGGTYAFTLRQLDQEPTKQGASRFLNAFRNDEIEEGDPAVDQFRGNEAARALFAKTVRSWPDFHPTRSRS